MHYYDIALPISIPELFTYKSNKEISQGCRVYVSFQNTYHTGIIWKAVTELKDDIKYKNIIEILDKDSKIPNQLLQLAEWMSRYYQVSLGLVLNSMLPSAFNVQTQLKIKKIDQITIRDNHLKSVLEKIPTSDWYDIERLKKDVKISHLNAVLEELENQGAIEILRTFDQKIKKKIANYIVLNFPEKLPELTEKQLSVYNELKQIGNEFPIAKVVHRFTYYIIKKLRDLNLLQIVPREVKNENNILPSKRKLLKIKPTDEQKLAIEMISNKIEKQQFGTFLLFGITGSGKTEVYIQAIKTAQKIGKSALMLVPEISLTPQMVERFFNAFGEEIAILHSHLSERERWEQWNKIRTGKSRIVIGARSAIFAPLENIGIIIVDEEHETSYKQDSAPRYNGRDIAIVRAKISNAVVMLGSATPSMESWMNAIDNKSALLKLTKRPQLAKLPQTKIIDMKLEDDPKKLLSADLRRLIEQKLQKKEQVILLHNRRGHSSFVQCVSCGKLFSCDKCDISMNFHSRNQSILCHYCGEKKNLPRKCPDCGNYKFSFGAPGTQQIEKQLQIVFPKAKILRMDSDSARKKDSYNSMFERMRSGSVDILLGTQMIAKGLDFANVTLVGVVLADIGLNLPDFRAAERTFQLLTQVAGRSGRGAKSGEVIIQTYNPEHYSIQCAMKQDFELFAGKELELRKRLKYPPFYKIIRLVFSHKDENYLRKNVFQNAAFIENLRKMFENNINILGPIQAPLVKINKQYRYHIILKSESVKVLSQAVNFLNKNIKLSSTIKMFSDVDPYSLL